MVALNVALVGCCIILVLHYIYYLMFYAENILREKL